jgi:hypothetical protein
MIVCLISPDDALLAIIKVLCVLVSLSPCVVPFTF